MDSKKCHARTCNSKNINLFENEDPRLVGPIGTEREVQSIMDTRSIEHNFQVVKSKRKYTLEDVLYEDDYNAKDSEEAEVLNEINYKIK